MSDPVNPGKVALLRQEQPFYLAPHSNLSLYPQSTPPGERGPPRVDVAALLLSHGFGVGASQLLQVPRTLVRSTPLHASSGYNLELSPE